jgi:hypothetical protein
MRCYFHGSVNGRDQLARQIGTVSFAIPDLGVIFRSRWNGNLIECQYAALLSLLKFIENNNKAFNDEEVEILSDASVVIYQLTKDTFILKSIEPFYRLVQSYKLKFPFKVKWIPDRENSAYTGLQNTPPMKPSVEINYEIKDDNNDRQSPGGYLPIE